MSDEIYINIGTTIQQPYQGQIPASAQSNETKQIVKQTPANSQTSYRSPSQTPSTYRNPVSAQQNNQVSKQTPFTYAFQSQSPFTYQVTAQQPAVYQYRQPSTQQSPYIANGQGVVNNNVNKQSPFTTPITNVSGRQPVIYQHRSPFTYRNPVNAQQDYSYRNPFTYQDVGPVATRQPGFGQSPVIYWYQQAVYLPDPEAIEFYQGPQGDGYDRIGSMQWFVETQNPIISQGYLQPTRTPIAGGPVIAQGQIPYIYLGQSFRVSISYQHQAGATQQPGFTLVTQNPVNAQQPLIGQSPFTYRSPVNAQSNESKNKQSPFIYQYQQPVRQPVIYQHRQPFTYQNRQPLTTQTPISNVNQQTTVQVSSNIQESNPHIGQARQPSIYQHRSPFTYQSPVNAQTNTQNVVRQPNIYQTPYQVNYQHRSPYIYQTPYSTTRTIGPVAKVKGVYVNDSGTIRKVEEVYTNSNSTPEKIHQTVPAARFSKNPSNTQQ